MKVPEGFHKDVRKVCNKLGWTMHKMDNDKYKNGVRRVSYYSRTRKGLRIPDDIKKKILRSVKELTRKYEIENDVKVKWVVANGIYSQYDKLCVYFSK